MPGDNVKLTIKTTDADGKPVSAVVGLTATDDAILEMIEKREQAPRLPVMVMLEPEVSDLADAHECGYTMKAIPGLKVNSFFENEDFAPILRELIRHSARPLHSERPSRAARRPWPATAGCTSRSA